MRNGWASSVASRSAVRIRSAPSSPPLKSGLRLSASAVGGTPPGVAATISYPASLKTAYGPRASSAQKPAGCRVPSASVQWSDAGITKRIFAIEGLPVMVSALQGFLEEMAVGALPHPCELAVADGPQVDEADVGLVPGLRLGLVMPVHDDVVVVGSVELLGHGAEGLVARHHHAEEVLRHVVPAVVHAAVREARGDVPDEVGGHDLLGDL